MGKRVSRIAVALAVILLLGSIALAQPAVPILHGPFELERPLRTSVDGDFVTTQIIPEGCLGHGFETYLVIFNSSDAKAQVAVVASGLDCYYTTGFFEVKPHQRQTWDAKRMFNDPGAWTNPDVSFQVLSDTPGVYAQVSMYWDGGGHTSTGFMK